MTGDMFTGAVLGASPMILWKVIAWFAARDRARSDEDRRDLWTELNKVKTEQADLRAKVAALPIKGDIERLEERIDKRLDDLTRLILEALKREARA